MSISLPVPGDTVVTTYNELRDEISAYMNRSDLTAQFPGWVHKVEEVMNRRLALSPVLPMHVVTSLTLSTEYVELPLRILKIDEIDVPDYWSISYVDSRNIASLKDDTADPALPPRYYTQIGSKIRLCPAPQTSFTANLIYFEKIPQLTEISQTNWLIQDHSDAYLFGVLAYGRFFEDDPQLRDFCMATFNDMLDGILAAYPTATDSTPLRCDVGLLTRWCA
jgi:hypothetical protein